MNQRLQKIFRDRFPSKVLERTTRDEAYYIMVDPGQPGYNPDLADRAWDVLQARFDKHNDRRTKDCKPYEFAIDHYTSPETWSRILLAGPPGQSRYPHIVYSGIMDAALGFQLDKPVTLAGKFRKPTDKIHPTKEPEPKQLLDAYTVLLEHMMPLWNVYLARMQKDIQSGRDADAKHTQQYATVCFGPLDEPS
jgi:hypothetical protein